MSLSLWLLPAVMVGYVRHPNEIPEHYELHVVFTRSGAGGGPFFLLPIRDRFVVLEFDRGLGDGSMQRAFRC